MNIQSTVQKSITILHYHCQGGGTTGIVEGNHSSTNAYHARTGYYIHDIRGG